MQQELSLKPHDVAILVKLLAHPNDDWRQVDIAMQMEISQGEIAKSLARLNRAGLVNGKVPNRQAALEFLVHAVKYVFPAELGPIMIGVPTAISAPAHQKMVVSSEDVYVWPWPHGLERGQSIAPLYYGLPKAIHGDEKFYNLMSAVEIIRIGRARERKLAEKYLEKQLEQG